MRRNGKKGKWDFRQIFIQNGSKWNTIGYVFQYKNTGTLIKPSQTQCLMTLNTFMV